MNLIKQINYSRILSYGIILILLVLFINVGSIIFESNFSNSLTGLVSENIRIINDTNVSITEKELFSEGSYIIYYSITTIFAMLIIVILIIISLPKLKKYT